MGRSLDVHLYVTPRCNLSCPHCYYDALERGRQPDNILGLDEVASILTELCARFDADISLEGGEPFMRAGVGAMLAALSPTVLSHITVTTNGTVRVAAPVETLRQLGGLRLSIDGHTDALQQELRGIDVAPVLATCARLHKLGVPHTVRMTLFKRNVRQLAEIYDWVAHNKIAQLSLFEFQSSGRGIGQDLRFGINASDFDQLLDDMIGLRRPECLRRLTLNVAQRRVVRTHDREEDLAVAGFAIKDLPETPNCTINYDGVVGVSPWMVTAHGAPDAWAHATDPGFFDRLEEAAAAGVLRDTGTAISRVQLRWDR